MLYLSAKNHVRRIIDRNFPPEMSVRFTIRSDSEIWKPSEDAGIYGRWKAGKEQIHILFDGLMLTEISQDTRPELAEVLFLKSFKQAIVDGKISFTKKLEWTDNATARRNKRELKAKKKEKVDDAILYAKQNPDSFEVTQKKIEHIGKRKVYKARG